MTKCDFIVEIGTEVECDELGIGLICDIYFSNIKSNNNHKNQITSTVTVVFKGRNKLHRFQYNEEQDSYYDILCEFDSINGSKVVYLTALK